MADVTFSLTMDVTADFSVSLSDVLDNLDQDLLAYWRFEEASGTREDRRGKVPLTPSNAPSTRTGKFGDAVDFDSASTQSLAASSSSLLDFDGSSDFSVAGWFMIDDTTHYHPVLVKWANTGDNRQWLIEHDDVGGDMEFALSDDGTSGGTITVARSNAFTTTGVWAYFYAEYRSSDGRMEVTVNEGTPNTTPTHSGGIFQSAAVVESGVADLGVSNDQMDGGVDEVMVWNRLLTSEERAALYHSGTGVDPRRFISQFFSFDMDVDADFSVDLTNNQLENIGNNILAYWPFEESSGDREDFTLNVAGNDLSPTNAPSNRTGLKGSELDLVQASSQYVASDGSSSMDAFDGTANFSFFGWITADTLTQNNDAGLWGKFDDDGGSDDRGYLVFFDDSANRLAFLISEDGATTSASASPTLVLSAATRYAVYAEYDAALKQVTLQIDNGTGSNLATDTATNAVINVSALSFRVGHGINSAGDMFFDGGIDELACWGRKLTGGEKYALYNGGAGVNLRNELEGFAFNMDVDADFTAALEFAAKLFRFEMDVLADFSVALSEELEFSFNMDLLADFTSFLTAISTIDAIVDTTLNDQAGEAGNRLTFAGLSSSVGSPPQWTVETLADGEYIGALDQASLCGEPSDEAEAASTPATIDAILLDGVRDVWFGRLFILPLRVDAGFLLTDASFEFEMYSSFETETHTLDAFTNNADSGVTLGSFPALPFSLLPLSSREFTVDISTVGPPDLDGTLDFEFDLYTIIVPVTATRTSLFSVEPVAPVTERLRFKTDVIKRRNELEQRRVIRATPRQMLEYTYDVDGLDRQILESQVFDGQGRIFGVPVWFEPSYLTAAASPTETTISIDDTRYGDFQVGGLLVLWHDARTYEIMQIDSMTDTSVTFTAQLKQSHEEGTRIYPVKIANMSSSARGSRQKLNLQNLKTVFTVHDNDVDLSSTATFPSFNSKVLLSEPNMVSGSLSESFERTIIDVDSDAGRFQVFSVADVSRRVHSKTFFCGDRQRLWEVRRLLHALKGRAVSFYIPTFFDDFTPTRGVDTGSLNLFFENFGYTKLVERRRPRDAVRLVLTDGTSVSRNVVDSEVIDTTEERLQVDAVWGVNASLSEISRVEYLTKVRMNSDEIQINHLDALGRANAVVPVIGVLE